MPVIAPSRLRAALEIVGRGATRELEAYKFVFGTSQEAGRKEQARRAALVGGWQKARESYYKPRVFLQTGSGYAAGEGEHA